MRCPEHDELVQRRLDDALTPDERARVDALLLSDEDVAGFDQRLRAVRHILEPADMPGPPPGFAAMVMRQVTETHSRLSLSQRLRRRVMAAFLSGATKRALGTTGGHQEDGRGREGAAMRLLWAVGTAAALTLALGIYTGFPQPEGAAGTAGASASNQAQAGGDRRAVADAQARSFLESEAFARLLQDANAATLLSSAGVRSALADPEFRAALVDPAFLIALRDPTWRTAMGDAQLWRELKAAGEARGRDPRMPAVLTNPGVQRAFGRDDLRPVWVSNEFASSLDSQVLVSALNETGFVAALQSPLLLEALAARGQNVR